MRKSNLQATTEDLCWAPRQRTSNLLRVKAHYRGKYPSENQGANNDTRAGRTRLVIVLELFSCSTVLPM